MSDAERFVEWMYEKAPCDEAVIRGEVHKLMRAFEQALRCLQHVIDECDEETRKQAANASREPWQMGVVHGESKLRQDMCMLLGHIKNHLMKGTNEPCS